MKAYFYKFLIIVLLLMLILGFASPGAASPPPQNTPVKVCTLPSHLFFGQPWEFPGGASGATRDSTLTEAFGQVDYSQIIDDLSLTGSTVGPQPVTIMIVDDFSTYSEPTEDQPERYWPHGDYVFQVARTWLDTLLGPGTQSLDSAGSWVYTNQNIRMIEVSSGGYDPALINQNLQTAFTAEEALENRVFVVNMSFGIFNCQQYYEALSFDPEKTLYQHLIEKSDLLVGYRPTIESPTQWQVALANGPLGEGLTIGDTITSISFGDRTVTDSQQLYGLLSSLNLSDLLTLTVEGRDDLIDISAFDLYKALRGPSLSLALALQIPNTDESISGLISAQQRAEALIRLGLQKEPHDDADATIANLHTILSDPNRKIFSVAAAGNIDGIAPMLPGRWYHVISVSSLIANPSITINNITFDNIGETRWPDSSSGEAMAPGGWFALPCTNWEAQGSDNTQKCTQTGSAVDYVAGTSFAAPTVSVLVAWSLSQQACDFDTPNTDNACLSRYAELAMHDTNFDEQALDSAVVR